VGTTLMLPMIVHDTTPSCYSPPSGAYSPMWP
jgi:hypothetical protein